MGATVGTRAICCSIKIDERGKNAVFLVDNSGKESRESVANTFFFINPFCILMRLIIVHKPISAENMRQRFWIITGRNYEAFSNGNANRQRIMLFELQILDEHLNNVTFIFCVCFYFCARFGVGALVSKWDSDISNLRSFICQIAKQRKKFVV